MLHERSLATHPVRPAHAQTRYSKFRHFYPSEPPPFVPLVWICSGLEAIPPLPSWPRLVPSASPPRQLLRYTLSNKRRSTNFARAIVSKTYPMNTCLFDQPTRCRDKLHIV